MNFFQRVTKVWDWFKHNFESLTTGSDSLAVVFTEHLQAGVNSGTVGFLASAFDQLAKTKIAENVLTALKVEAPKIIATELAIQGVGINPTDKELADFEARIITALNLSVDKSKPYSVIAAQVYRVLHTLANKGAAITFSDGIAAVQSSFVLMNQDLADGTIPTSGTAAAK